jgi:hypothetical protein
MTAVLEICSRKIMAYMKNTATETYGYGDEIQVVQEMY